MQERVSLYLTLKQVAAGLLAEEQLRTLQPELFQRCLLRRAPLALTEKGRQMVFQIECETALRTIAQEGRAHGDEVVWCWLIAQRFALEPGKKSPRWCITPRGRAWLETLASFCDDSDQRPQSLGGMMLPSQLADM